MSQRNQDLPPEAASQKLMGDFIAQDLKLREAPPARRGGLPWYRQAFQEDYLDIYLHRDQAEAARAVRFLAGALDLQPAQRLLDLCCGPGRHLAFLCNYVNEAVGLDLSRVLLTRAREDCGLKEKTGIPNPQSGLPPGPQLCNPQLLQADMRFLPLAAAAFDRVVNLFTSFGYFENEADNAAVARGIARILRPGGLLALDHINREAMLAHLKPRTERALPDGRLLLEQRRYDEATRRVIKDIACSEPGGQVKGWRESVRVYAPDELEGLLADAGLKPVARHGDYDGGPWRPDSSRLILIAKKG